MDFIDFEKACDLLADYLDFFALVHQRMPYAVLRLKMKSLQDKKNKEVWKNFQNFPDLYKRVRLDTIQIMKKRDLGVYEARLNKFTENTKKNIMYGEWNDSGRLYP